MGVVLWSFLWTNLSLEDLRPLVFGRRSALTRKALRPACAFPCGLQRFNKAEYQWKSKPQFIANPSGESRAAWLCSRHLGTDSPGGMTIAVRWMTSDLL
jgi:hypothetical protein